MHITEDFYSDSAVYAHHGGFFQIQKNHRKIKTEFKNIFNGNGIFICPLHIIIQYSAVLLPPPALISHCDQEKFTVKVFL